jgi:hypothetical protein
LRGLVDDDFAPVLPVGRPDLVAQLALEQLHAAAQPAQLVLEPQHVLDAREVEPELGREPLDEPQPLDVGLRVHARATGRAGGPDEAFRLVHAQRLRMEAGEVGRDRDHVEGPVTHEKAFSRGRSLNTRW